MAMQSVCAWIRLPAGDPCPFLFSPEFPLTSFPLLPGSRDFPVQCQPQWHAEVVSEIVTVSPLSKASLFCPFIPNRETPATGKLLTVSCISTTHSKLKNWKASRAEAGIDIFNHSLSPLTLFNASSRLAVGKSAADSGTTSGQVLYLYVTSAVQLLALAICNLWPEEAAASPARTLWIKAQGEFTSCNTSSLPPPASLLLLNSLQLQLLYHLICFLIWHQPAMQLIKGEKPECSQAEQPPNSHKHVTSHLCMLDNFTSFCYCLF